MRAYHTHSQYAMLRVAALAYQSKTSVRTRDRVWMLEITRAILHCLIMPWVHQLSQG